MIALWPRSSGPDGRWKITKAVVRLLLVAEEYRNRGIGTFLLKNTIELAVRDGCDALFYTATSQSGQGFNHIIWNHIIYGPYYHPTVWFQSRGETIPATGVKIAEKLKLKCQIEVDLKNENPLLEEVEDNLKGYLVLFKPLE